MLNIGRMPTGVDLDRWIDRYILRTLTKYYPEGIILLRFDLRIVTKAWVRLL